MARTIAELKKELNPSIQLDIVKAFASSSDLLNYLPIVRESGSNIRVNYETSIGTAAFVDANGTITSGARTSTQLVTRICRQ